MTDENGQVQTFDGFIRECLSLKRSYPAIVRVEIGSKFAFLVKVNSSAVHGPLASYPGSFRGEGKEPGTHCMRMRAIAAEFRRDRILLRYVRKFMTSRQSATLAVNLVDQIWSCFYALFTLSRELDTLLCLSNLNRRNV